MTALSIRKHKAVFARGNTRITGFPRGTKTYRNLSPFLWNRCHRKKRHEQNKSNDLLCIWCILQKRGISFCLHLWFYHPLLWMSTTKIACTHFFAQICHWFSVCASCLKFSALLSAPYKFVQAVQGFSCVFKRQQIAKFAKFMKPLSQLLQLFNCILLVFFKNIGNFAGIFFVQSFRSI